MKRLLLTIMILACLTGQAMTQDDGAQTFTFAGLNYQGDLGFVFGTGQTFGNVTVTPFVRFSIDSTLTDELRFTKTLGAETIIWLHRTPKIRFGLIATLANLDWLENQDESIGAYFSQSAGASFYWQIADGIGASLSAKGKAQLFQSDTLYKDKFSIYLIFVTDKLKFLKFF